MPQSEQSIIAGSYSTPMMRGFVKPAQGAIAITADSAVTVYQSEDGGFQNLQFLRIQNVGTGVVKVALNDVATAKVYNFILNVDTGAEAGNGGVIDIPGSWNVTKVSCYSLAGSSVALTVIGTPLGVRIIN